MIAVTSDAAIEVIGGIAVAIITGGFALTGIILTTRRQRDPIRVGPAPVPSADCVGCEECRMRLVEMEQDRDRWRTLAMEWVPHRRQTD